MKFGLAFGWGIGIYAVMRMVSDAVLIYTVSSAALSNVIELIALIILCTVAGRSLHFSNWKDIAPYSILWALIAVILNGVFLVPFMGLQAYTAWNALVAYALIAILPLLAPFSYKRHHEPASIS